jgi:hypothetical protein
LKELNSGEFRDPDALLAGLNSLWEYCTDWISLRVINDKERRTRWAEHPWWQIVRDAAFDGARGPAAKRSRQRSHARARIAVAFSVSYAASAGVLQPITAQKPRLLVDGMSEGAATAFVHEHLHRTMVATAEEAANELVAEYGAKGAVLHIIEKQNAACARFSSAAEEIAERVALRETADARRTA